LPQLVHFWLSTRGALWPRWESAPTGHTRTAGQGWFWGHRLVTTSTLTQDLLRTDNSAALATEPPAGGPLSVAGAL